MLVVRAMPPGQAPAGALNEARGSQPFPGVRDIPLSRAGGTAHAAPRPAPRAPLPAPAALDEPLEAPPLFKQVETTL